MNDMITNLPTNRISQSRPILCLSDIRATNLSKSFTHKMAAETSWHRYGTKLRHCHPANRPCTSPRPKLHLDQFIRFAGLMVVTERQRHAERERDDAIPSVAASGYSCDAAYNIARRKPE